MGQKAPQPPPRPTPQQDNGQRGATPRPNKVIKPPAPPAPPPPPTPPRE